MLRRPPENYYITLGINACKVFYVKLSIFCLPARYRAYDVLASDG